MQIARTMKDASFTGQQHEYASIIEDSIWGLLQMIDDVPDYSKLSPGSLSLNTQAISIPVASFALP